MHNALIDRSVDAFGAIRKHVSFSANLRQYMSTAQASADHAAAAPVLATEVLGDAADATSWRIIDHCAAVTRSYAIFESFVLQILREYLSFLSRSYKISSLGAEFRSKYTKGLGQILLDQDKQRYRNLDIAGLIVAAGDAIGDKAGYQIEPEALLRSEQNLRMSELQRLFGQCGLLGIEPWITRHPSIVEFFATQSRLSETAVSELRQIVDYRNEAAHGDVDDVLGADVLIEFTHFFEALCLSIGDFVRYDTLRRAKALGSATVVGVISERFRNDIVVAKVRQATISIGDQLYIFGKGMATLAEIGSLRIDNIDTETAKISDEVEVGLALGVRAKVGCELLRMN